MAVQLPSGLVIAMPPTWSRETPEVMGGLACWTMTHVGPVQLPSVSDTLVFFDHAEAASDTGSSPALVSCTVTVTITAVRGAAWAGAAANRDPRSAARPATHEALTT